MYSVGDKVRVIDKERMDRYLAENGGGCRAYFVDRMYDFCGKQCQVITVKPHNNTYRLKDDNHNSLWFDAEMVEQQNEAECYESELLGSFLNEVFVE